MAEARANGTIEWCAGMPLVHQRPLADGERAALQREAVRLNRLGTGMLGAYAAAVAICMAAFALAGPGSAAAEAVLAICVTVLALVLLPVQALVARDAFRRSAGIRKDLRAGYVKLFAGKLRSRLRTDETLSRLRRAHLLPPDADAEVSIEVLPASRRVWRVVGEPVSKWIVARSAEVAQTPEFASLAAQWLEPIAVPGDARLLGGQREMSEPERSEVRRCVRRLRFRLMPFAIGLTLWVALLFAALARGGAFPGPASRLHFGFLAFAALWTDARWFRALWVARRLDIDARAGRLVILRTEHTDAHDEASDEASDEGGDGAAHGIVPAVGAPRVVEVLPASRWLWTEDGRPATWRVASV